MKDFLLKITASFRKHDFIQIGTATCFHQKNSRLCECKKCGLTGFVAKEMKVALLNTCGCNGSQKHL